MNTTITQAPGDERETEAVAEISIEQKETEGLSQGQIVRRRFFRHRGALISMIVLAFIIILAFTSVGVNLWGLRIPGWWPYSWDQIAAEDQQRRPDAEPVPARRSASTRSVRTRSAATSSRSSCAVPSSRSW